MDVGGPAVTYIEIPWPDTGGYEVGDAPDVTGSSLRDHIAASLLSSTGITRFGSHEGVMAVVHPSGIWRAHSKPGTTPTWVWSDNAEMARILSEFFGCPVGRPTDVESTHWTRSGPPGIGPNVIPDTLPPDLQMNISDTGRTIQSRLFGHVAGLPSGKTGVAPTATTLTLTGQAAPGSLTKWNGLVVVVAKTATAVWGRIKSNTTAAPPVVTVDRWYNPATPGGTAGATPAVTSAYVIVDAAGPCWFVGLTTKATFAPVTPSTTVLLPTEYTHPTAGLNRKIAPWAHTAGANTTTLTPVFTANAHDVLPATITGIGVFNSKVKADTVQTMMFITKLSTSATLSAATDTLTITETITGT